MDLNTLIHKLGQNRVVQNIAVNEWEQSIAHKPAADIVRIIFHAVGITESFDTWVEKLKGFMFPFVRLSKLQKAELQTAFEASQLPFSHTVMQYLAAVFKTNIIVCANDTMTAGLFDTSAEAPTCFINDGDMTTAETFGTFKKRAIIVPEIVSKHMTVAEVKSLAVAKGIDTKGLLKKQIIAKLLE